MAAAADVVFIYFSLWKDVDVEKRKWESPSLSLSLSRVICPPRPFFWTKRGNRERRRFFLLLSRRLTFLPSPYVFDDSWPRRPYSVPTEKTALLFVQAPLLLACLALKINSN